MKSEEEIKAVRARAMEMFDEAVLRLNLTDISLAAGFSVMADWIMEKVPEHMEDSTTNKFLNGERRWYDEN